MRKVSCDTAHGGPGILSSFPRHPPLRPNSDKTRRGHFSPKGGDGPSRFCTRTSPNKLCSHELQLINEPAGCTTLCLTLLSPGCWLVQLCPSSQKQPPALLDFSVPWKAEPCRRRALRALGTGFQSGLANGVHQQKAGGWQNGRVGVFVPLPPLLLPLILRESWSRMFAPPTEWPRLQWLWLPLDPVVDLQLIPLRFQVGYNLLLLKFPESFTSLLVLWIRLAPL